MATNIRFEDGRFSACNIDPWNNFRSIEFDVKDLNQAGKDAFIRVAESISSDVNE